MSITQYNSSIRQMSQSKFNSMKNASGKIPDLANQIVMTDSEDTNTSCLRTEVVYDMTSSDASKNWGYPNGIQGNNTAVGGKDFSRYSALIITAKQGVASMTSIMDLTTLNSSSNTYNSGALGCEASDTDYCKFTVNAQKTEFTCNRIGYRTTSGSIVDINSENAICMKIIGVLKTPSMIYTGDELTAGNGISIANNVISSSSYSELLNATKYNISTNTQVPISKATLQRYNYILIEVEGYDASGTNKTSRATGYFKVSDLVEYNATNDCNSIPFYSRRYALLGTMNFTVNTNNMVFSCEFASPYGQTDLNAVANDQIYIGNIWGIK